MSWPEAIVICVTVLAFVGLLVALAIVGTMKKGIDSINEPKTSHSDPRLRGRNN